jgi:CheY-like chemotaxis protein
LFFTAVARWTSNGFLFDNACIVLYDVFQLSSLYLFPCVFSIILLDRVSPPPIAGKVLNPCRIISTQIILAALSLRHYYRSNKTVMFPVDCQEVRCQVNPDLKLRVVFIEDNKSIRRLLSEIFDDRGYEIFGFSNPAICPLQMIPECRCDENQTCTDIIVSDLNMPNITGLRFIENQKKKNCKCKHVALISANWTKKDASLAHQIGCRVFTKPFFFEEFDKWLDEVEQSVTPTRKLCSWFQEQSTS